MCAGESASAVFDTHTHATAQQQFSSGTFVCIASASCHSGGTFANPKSLK